MIHVYYVQQNKMLRNDEKMMKGLYAIKHHQMEKIKRKQAKQNVIKQKKPLESKFFCFCLRLCCAFFSFLFQFIIFLVLCVIG